MTECNVKNRTIFCDDNLDIMRGINSECIDLIYLDPPFNKNKEFTAPIGSSAEGASFKDIFTEKDLKKEWLQTLEEDQSDLYRYLKGIEGIGKPYNFAYLAYMAIRLLECRRVLTPTGSIYLHCDLTMSHYLKTTMDCIFGEENFRNEITWKRTSAHNDSRNFGMVRDVLLFYGNTTLNTDAIRTPLRDAYVSKHYTQKDARGRYRTSDLTGPGTARGLSGRAWRGVDPGAAGRCWSVPLKGRYAKWIEEHIIPGYRAIESLLDRLDALDEADMIHWPKARGGGGCPASNVIWRERTGKFPPICGMIYRRFPPKPRTAPATRPKSH